MADKETIYVRKTKDFIPRYTVMPDQIRRANELGITDTFSEEQWQSLQEKFKNNPDTDIRLTGE